MERATGRPVVEDSEEDEGMNRAIYDDNGNWLGDMQTPMNPADPQHYKTKSMECREVIKVMTEGLTGEDAYYMGNVMKYLYRYADKNGTEDLDKAITYIGFLKGE